MAQQTTFTLQVPFTTPSGNILTDWIKVSGYNKLRFQYYLTGMGFSGNIEILATTADEGGRPDETRQYIIPAAAGASSGTWNSPITPASLCIQYIRFRINIPLGTGSATAVIVGTLQE